MIKQKLLFIATFLFAVSSLFAQKNTATLISSNENEIVINFKLQSFDFESVNTPKGKSNIIKADELSSLLKEGAPDVLKFTESVIIANQGEYKIELVEAVFKEFDNIEIAPSKGNLLRTENPADVPYTYGEQYSQDAFFPAAVANLKSPYIVRDYRGQSINVYPFRYNAVTKTLKVYSDITVRIYNTGNSGTNNLNKKQEVTVVAKEFNEIYKNQFLNYNSERYDPLSEEGAMLVICHDAWTTEMQAFVDWKNMIGRPCEMVTVTEAGGTSTAIATYVENYYNNNGLAFLLLVGDAAEVPTNSGGGLGGDSDNAYAYILGDDHYLDFLVGRFSAESADDVITQVQRTLDYESGTELTDGWLNVTMGVASDQGPGDDNEDDFEHYRNLATDLLNFTYVQSLELFDGSQSGNDAPGDPTSTMVGNDIDAGVGIINYTGHGSTTSWSSSGYSVSNINTLTNDKMLPFIWSVACVNGNFVGQTCFGEAWLRANNAGEPTGAIGIMASTINQSWDPPMAAQDEMVDILTESYTENIKRTFAGLSIDGCHLMNDEYSDFAMTDTWTCFGDPSLLVRTDDPADMTITHNATILFGSPTFTVNTGFDEAFAVLTLGGEIIGTATGATAEVPTDGLNPGDEATLAVTGFNKVTYIINLTVIAPEGPYIIIESALVNGETSLDYGQTENIDITLTNVGPELAMGVTATVTTTDEYVTSLTNNEDISFGDITGDNGTAVSSGSFTVTFANNVPDEYVVAFDVAINSTNKTVWEGQFNISANAPVVSSSVGNIDDPTEGLSFSSSPVTVVGEGSEYNYEVAVSSLGGNDNGLLDPGETVDIHVSSENNGHADFIDAVGVLTSSDEYVTINSGTVNFGTISAGEELFGLCNISIDELCPVGESIELTFTVTGGEYTDILVFNFPVGLQIEDFETGDFTAYNWTMGGTADWISSTDSQEGTYSAQSGDVNDNQSSDLSISCDVTSAGEISFWSKVNSESGWDFLKFYIDNQKQAEWSGSESWSESVFSVSAGNHTFKWAYEKDGSVTNGDDCAWVDFITFPGFSAKKSDTRSISITGTSLPAWMTLTDNNNGTALLTGTAPEEYGIHQVELEATDGGSIIVSQDFEVTVGTISVEAIGGLINVFPNPVLEVLNIEIPHFSNKTEIELSDISGKILKTTTLQSNITQIRVSDLAQGLYFLKIRQNREVKIKKIIIK